MTKNQDNNKIVLAAEMAARIPLYVGSLTALAMVFLTVGDVIGRYFFNAPIDGATELTRLGMAVVIFTALPVISAKGEHICVDLFDSFYSPKMARIRDGIIDILFGVGLLFLLPRIHILALRVLDYGEYTEYLHIPLYYVNFFFLFWVGLSAICLILRGILLLLKLIPHADEPLINESL
ncbi:MAG: TRAP transporter small permease [Rhizobiales bacterium]|nr:TRAP transporter small permease [Hyphomicrobiales bacterium]